MIRNLTLLLLTALAACQTGSENRINIYFDLEEKVNQTVDQLIANPHSLTKIAILDNDTDTAIVYPDTLQWKRELELFSSASINKVQYQGIYDVNDKQDDNSNLIIRSYIHPDPESAKVPFMEVYYLESMEQVKFIRLTSKEKNAGFSVYRDLSLDFEEIRGSYFLNRYTMEGYQKIFGQDTVRFKIIGEVSY